MWEVGKKTVIFRFARRSLIRLSIYILAEGRIKHFHVCFQSFFYINFLAEKQLSVTNFTAHEFRSFQIVLICIGVYAYIRCVYTVAYTRRICHRRNFSDNYRKKAATKYTGPEMIPIRCNPQL